MKRTFTLLCSLLVVTFAMGQRPEGVSQKAVLLLKLMALWMKCGQKPLFITLTNHLQLKYLLLVTKVKRPGKPCGQKMAFIFC